MWVKTVLIAAISSVLPSASVACGCSYLRTIDAFCAVPFAAMAKYVDGSYDRASSTASFTIWNSFKGSPAVHDTISVTIDESCDVTGAGLSTMPKYFIVAAEDADSVCVKRWSEVTDDKRSEWYTYSRQGEATACDSCNTVVCTVAGTACQSKNGVAECVSTVPLTCAEIECTQDFYVCLENSDSEDATCEINPCYELKPECTCEFMTCPSGHLCQGNGKLTECVPDCSTVECGAGYVCELYLDGTGSKYARCVPDDTDNGIAAEPEGR